MARYMSLKLSLGALVLNMNLISLVITHIRVICHTQQSAVSFHATLSDALCALLIR